jgi:phage baseplate assembly protein W
MSRSLGRINVVDLKENDYKVLGIGINTASNRGGSFAVNYTTIQQARFNLINLILTKKGERVGQPDFGCDVWKVLFEPIISGNIESKIENTIIEAVEYWLPYISIDEILVDINDQDIDRHTVNLEIRFSLTSNSNITDTVTLTVNN